MFTKHWINWNFELKKRFVWKGDDQDAIFLRNGKEQKAEVQQILFFFFYIFSVYFFF